MGQKGVRLGFVLLVTIVSRGVLASEPPCVTATFFGVSAPFEEAVREHLKNEPGVLFVDQAAERTCWRLVIEMREKTARILLDGNHIMKAEFELDDVLPALWPRAIALSAAGFLELSMNPDQNEVKTKSDEAKPTQHDANVEAQRDENAKREIRPATEAKPNASQNDLKGAGDSTKEHRASAQIRLHFLVGARLVPKFRVGMAEALLGIGALMGPFSLDLSLVGIWGRKSADIGKIHNAGIGARLTLWGQVFHQNAFALRFGGAAEVFGLWGYGREADGATSHRVVRPAMDLLLLLGGSLAFGPRVNASAAIGGGLTVVYFHLKADEENVTGLDGGLATLVLGIEFDL